ncbi:MAG: dethiobiotin synthase [Desulfatibacillum sp.]|nr:dethiobiotin synthase [Desulfatibacillum sp.]
MKTMSIFVTGTDTDVGKTLVSAMLMAGLEDAHYWKPVQSGSDQGTDAQWIGQMTGLSQDRFLPETHLLKAYLSPHAAASPEGVRISLDDFQIPLNNGPLIVEGAGGVMVPLNEKDLMLDLMKTLSLPVLLVARSALGTINHTLLTLDALRQQGLDVLGVVMNGPKNPSNKEAIEHYGKTRVVLELEPIGEINRVVLTRLFEEMKKLWI